MPIDEKERKRRSALVRAHYAPESAHDLEGIMRTFSPDAVMLFNGMEFASDEAIRWAHGHIGMTAEAGALSNLDNIIDLEHFTDEEVVIEGRVCGKHTGEFLGVKPTGRQVELPFVAFYRFDDAGKLASERVVMNLGVLQMGDAAPNP